MKSRFAKALGAAAVIAGGVGIYAFGVGVPSPSDVPKDTPEAQAMVHVNLPAQLSAPAQKGQLAYEATCMACAQVIGNDAAITVGGQAGNFQLNVMLPMIAYNLVQSLEIMSAVSRLMADSAIAGFTVNEERVNEALERNPILVTALNSVIGYDLGAATAKQAYKEGRPIKEVALETTGLSEEELDRLLDPLDLAKGGIKE